MSPSIHWVKSEVRPKRRIGLGIAGLRCDALVNLSLHCFSHCGISALNVSLTVSLSTSSWTTVASPVVVTDLDSVSVKERSRPPWWAGESPLVFVPLTAARSRSSLWGTVFQVT